MVPMIEYCFIPFNKKWDNHKKWPKYAEKLKNLVETCDFIVTNYGHMYPIQEISHVGDSLRGPTIVFKNKNGMTYFYNINGAYKLLLPVEAKQPPEPIEKSTYLNALQR